jgi:hypothetical protein
MLTVDRTRFLARSPARRRVRIVQPVPRRAPVRRGQGHAAPSGAEAQGEDPKAQAGPALARTTPEDATLRALFRVAAAAVARREEPKP